MGIAPTAVQDGHLTNLGSPQGYAPQQQQLYQCVFYITDVCILQLTAILNNSGLSIYNYFF